MSCCSAQVILVGEYGVGKSSLFRRFANDSFVTASDRASTLGLDNVGRVYQVGEEAAKRPIRLQLWDTGGMERVARSAYCTVAVVCMYRSYINSRSRIV